MHLIFDAYNLAGWFGYFDLIKNGQMSLKQARQKVFSAILGNPLLSLKDERVNTDLVFDSRIKTPKKIRREKMKGLKIIFSPKRETADDFIQRIVQTGDVVITNDRELKEKLEKMGIQVKWPEFFFGNKNQKN